MAVVRYRKDVGYLNTVLLAYDKAPAGGADRLFTEAPGTCEGSMRSLRWKRLSMPVSVSLRLPDDTAKALDELASAPERSRTYFIWGVHTLSSSRGIFSHPFYPG